jgi:hypothetical protein
VLHNGDDEDGRVAAFEINALYGVRVAAFLKEGQESLAYILYIFGFNVFEDVYGDEIAQELDEQFVVTENEFEAVVFGFVNGHGF